MEDKRSDAEIVDNSTAVVKKSNNFKWIFLIVFFALIVKIILTPKGPELGWFDYESGIKLAKQENKPILIAFYKIGTKFCREMWSDTYTNKGMIEFIEANFVPIMVDVDKRADLVKEYEVGYYPTHFIKTPDNTEVTKTRRGYDTPGQFRPILLEGLQKMNREPK